MKLLFAASEVRPWSSTGGLSDVLEALPRALARSGAHEVFVVSPLYRSARRVAERMGAPLVDTGITFTWVLRGVEYRGSFLRSAVGDGPVQLFLDCPALYDRDGLYVDAQHREWPDNPERFGFFSRAVATHAHALVGGGLDVLHANDWQTGLMALWADLAVPRRPAVVFGLHNLGYQGVYPADLVGVLGLPRERFHLHELEYYGQLNLLKAGIVYADLVVTVSPTYAEEITTPAHGHTLDGLMRAHRHKLHGVLNGIDTSTWDPAADPALPARYDAADPSGKAACHAALCSELDLDPTRRPLFGVISRFAWQKGIDVIADIAERIVEAGGAIAALGSGDEYLELRLTDLAHANPGAIGARIGYDVGLSHRIEAGTDAFLMPSRYEPCGLNQMYSMAYGTVPIVTATGGLRDTVIDATPEAVASGEATGFTCAATEPEALWHAIERAIAMFREHPQAWQQLMHTGMTHDFSWARPAQRYEALYRLAIEHAARR